MPLLMFVCPCMTLWWNIEVFYHRPLGSRRRDSCPLILFFPAFFISVVWLYFPQRGAQIRKANLIWTHDRANPSQLRNEKAVWSDSIPKASIESSSQMLVPFAALELLEYDEKGLGRVQWLSYVYDRRDWWRREAQYEDRDMKWLTTGFLYARVCEPDCKVAFPSSLLFSTLNWSQLNAVGRCVRIDSLGVMSWTHSIAWPTAVKCKVAKSSIMSTLTLLTYHT